SSESKVVCKICRRQLSKYACPICNLPYCSLTCFRSPSHSECSEKFHKKELETNIRSQSNRSAEERLKMMEILKRFEEDSLDSDGLLQEEGNASEDDDDLAKRFEGIDIEAASPDDLWALLKPEERNKFIKGLNDPSGELAQQLLASEEIYRDRREPWWEQTSLGAGEVENDSPSQMFGVEPETVPVPKSMVKPIPNGPPLIYNMLAICIAYAFVTRHLAVSPLTSVRPGSEDHQEIKRIVSQLVPFLTDRKSTIMHTNIPSVVTDIRSRYDPVNSPVSSATFALLLQDASKLLRPCPVGVVVATSPNPDLCDVGSHPNRTCVLVLSDLSKVFNSSSSPARNGKPNHVVHKLLFYAAHILSTPPAVLASLSTNILGRAVASDSLPPDPSISVSEPNRAQNSAPERQDPTKAGLIEEL
ncbi:hypothetical protein K435DRAFT_923385, partial [Dendrothele bispora CBS 962.96]